MGILLQAVADVRPRIFGNLRKDVEKSLRTWAKRRGLADLLYVVDNSDPSRIICNLYPVSESLEIKLSASRVSFGVKTSISGPGFHAALIDLCDALAEDCRIEWRWDTGGDETAYAVSRDCEALNLAFAEQLRAMTDFVAGADPETCHVLNMPIGLGDVRNPQKVLTPMGPIDRSVIVQLASADDDTVREAASTFFPWWHEPENGRFWLSTLRALLWGEVEWRAPRGAWESHVHKATEIAAATLRRLDVNLPPDLKEALDQWEGSRRAPRPIAGEIGYRRTPRDFELTGGWRVRLPGHYLEDNERDGETIVLREPDFEEVRGTSFRFSQADRHTKEPPSLEWPPSLADAKEHVRPTFSFRMPASPHPAREGGWRSATAHCVARREGEGSLLLLTVTRQAEPDVLLARVREVCDEVVFDPPPPLNKHLDA